MYRGIMPGVNGLCRTYLGVFFKDPEQSESYFIQPLTKLRLAVIH